MSPKERQRKRDQIPRTEFAVRTVSILIALGVLAVLIVDPTAAGSHGTIGERLAGAALLIGAVASAVRGFGLRGSRRYVQVITHPAVNWTLVAVGALAQTLL